MSNQESALQTQLDILALTSIVGVITQMQLRRRKVVSRSHLFKHLTALLDRGYLSELPARHYYSGAAGRPSPAYQLTEAGAKLLRENGIETRPSGLKSRDAIDHALAMLDCRLTLNARLDLFKNAYTDRPIAYGKDSAIRPDNLVVPHGSRPPLLFESESLEAGTGSKRRIRAKVKNLTRFFLSAEGREYDKVVRIVYVWPEDRHDTALEVWRQACRLERLGRGAPTLPFRLVFTPHRLFLDNADPLSLEAFEPLPLGGAEPEPRAARYIEGAAEQAAAPVEGGPVPARRREGLLDEETLCLLHEFRALHARGIEGMEDLDALLRLLRGFLTARGALAEELSSPLSNLVQPYSYAAAAFALERVAVIFFDHLGVPAVPATKQPDHLADTPVTVQALSERNTRPGLVVRVNLKRSRRLIMGWDGDAEALGHTFEAILDLLVLRSRDLDLTGEDK